MKKNSLQVFLRWDKVLLLFVTILVSLLPSCKDEYIYDDKEPDWLGNSIYDYLKSDGHFNTTVKLIDDLNYGDVLARTGSKTLFVATDSAYNEFFKNNSWGVKTYDELSLSQKKLLFNFSMINNMYTLQKFANYNYGGNLIEGTAMRQETALVAVDSITFDSPDKIPGNLFWERFKSKGAYLTKDDTPQTIVYFTSDLMTRYGLTDEDFGMIFNGATRKTGDVHLFGIKVIKRDVRCKNGYIHVLQSVLVPPTNMSEYVATNPSTKIFSKLLDRFCIPLYDAANTALYKTFHPEFTDSIFIKKYIATVSNWYISVSGWPTTNKLPIDPGWNSYKSGAIEADMAAMFVPTDDAMNNYFNSGIGAILKDRFGSWDNIPNDIIVPFLKRHMRTSFLESVPSKFSKMVDGENYRLPVEKSHIEKTYTASNGEVYLTNSVYPPVDYISIYSPVLLSANTKVMNWAINISETSVDGTQFAFYRLYLNSLTSKYGLFIPTDEYFTKYIDPIAYGQVVSGAMKYWYNEKTSSVNATVYRYDKTNDVVGDSVDVITNSTFLKNRLWELLDNHIVVGGVETGDHYFITKGNDLIKVTGSGNAMKIQGGGDIQRNTYCNVTQVYGQTNGKTYFIDKQIQPSLRSVYKALSENAEFSEFFTLLNGVPESYASKIFEQQGIDYRVKFFNAFRYTIYVPTNSAIQTAIANGTITTWQAIDNMSEPQRTAAIEKTVRFLKYHFQDNAVFFGQSVNGEYQSATLKTDNSTTHFGTAKNKYYKIGVNGNAGSLVLTMDTQVGTPVKTTKVLTDNGLYNIIVKDYIFSKVPSAYKNVDGTGAVSGLVFNSSTIVSSASAVIHQIDNVLTFE
ncbi:MAG: hypothetical protein QM751_15075 [Paludibacteraceae bacterium]